MEVKVNKKKMELQLFAQIWKDDNVTVFEQKDGTIPDKLNQLILKDIMENSKVMQLAKQLAEKQGRPRMSAQAVGGAVGHNRIAILIPCHRVVGTNGSLTGYAGGIDKKEKLLRMEHVNMDRFFVP